MYWRYLRRRVVEGTQDIVPRRRATGLRGKPCRCEEQFRHLVQNAPDVVMILETDFTVRYANPSVERVLGYRPEKLVGMNVSEYLAQEESDRVLDALRGKLDDSESVPTLIQFKMRHLDGSWRHLEAVGVELLDDSQVGGMAFYARDVTKRKALEDELARQAFYDPLTGLPNRALFMDRLGQALARAVRHKEPVAVLFLDLDNFKAVNDTFGHEVGDRLLIAVGRRFQSCLRPEDTVARFGGDEFTILLDAAKDAVSIAKRIVEALQAPVTLDGHTLFVTASIGIASSSSDEDRAEGLLRRADAAMYRSKKSGKTRWEVFYPSAFAEALVRLEPENDLGQTVERGEFGKNGRSIRG